MSQLLVARELGERVGEEPLLDEAERAGVLARQLPRAPHRLPHDVLLGVFVVDLPAALLHPPRRRVIDPVPLLEAAVRATLAAPLPGPGQAGQPSRRASAG